jgi:uncharacterized membrane protein
MMNRYAPMPGPRTGRGRGHFAPNVSRTERWASALAGIGLTAFAFRRGFERKYAVAGLGLIARGVSGFCPVSAAIGRDTDTRDTREALAGPRGIKVETAITIDRPIEEVYAFWRRLENLPRFMDHLRSVRELDDRRSHWVVTAPFGAVVEWDALIINEIPNELIGWRSLDNSDVVSAGSVRFRQTEDGTGVEVNVSLQYAPPGGQFGAGVAWLLGEEPSQQIPDDLRRLKHLLETSERSMPTSQPGNDRDDAGFFMR